MSADHGFGSLLGGVWALLMFAGMCLPQATAPATRDPIERLAIVDGNSAAGWEVTEGTLSPAAVQKNDPNLALLFRVPVDWKAGEAKYPIGWPRCWLRLPKDRQDWSKWDRLRVGVFTRTTREQLPSVPLTLIVSAGGRGSAWSCDLTGLKKDQWAEFVFPVEDIPGRDRVTEIKLPISESRYNHGDVVEFYIGCLELVRYTQPTLVGFEAGTKVAFADEPALPLHVEVLGVRPGEKAAVVINLQDGGRTVMAVTRELPAGRNRITVPLPKGLSAGQYQAVAKIGQQELSIPIRLVESPWQGGNSR